MSTCLSQLAPPRRRDPGYGECAGHPAGEFDPMGVTVYCDGRCTRRVRCPWCDEYPPAGEVCSCVQEPAK